jgi:hypothetical protein
MSHFTLTIHTRTQPFGDTAHAERAAIAHYLQQAAQQIQSGAPPTPLIDRGHVIGHYEFGPGMINGPGLGHDRLNIHVKPASEGGRVQYDSGSPRPAAAPEVAAS